MINLYNYDDPKKNKVPVGTSGVSSSKITPFDYDKRAQSTIIDRLLETSTSPYKLSGRTTIEQAPEKPIPGGFVGRAAKAAFDTANETINFSVSRFDELFKSLDNIPKNITEITGEDYSRPTGLTIGMTPEERRAFYDKQKKDTTPLARATNFGRAALSGLNIGFLPVTTQIEGAKEVPILKYPAEAGSYVFEKLGLLGSYTLGKGVDALPMSDETKTRVKPLAEELGAFISQYVGVKAGLKIAETGGKGTIGRLPISERAKGNIETGAKVGASLSMTPFSTAYGIASAKITQKVQERILKDIEITPKEGEKIMLEVKNELPADLAKIKVENAKETTRRMEEMDVKVEQSRREVMEFIAERRIIETPAKEMKPEDVNTVKSRLEKFKPENDKDILIKKGALQEVEAYLDAGIFLNEGKNINSFTKRLGEINNESKLLTSPETLERLPAPSGKAEGKGFTVTDKPDQLKINKQKLLNEFRKTQESYNKNPTPSNLAKLRKARVDYSASFEKPTLTPAEKTKGPSTPAKTEARAPEKTVEKVRTEEAETPKAKKEKADFQSRVYERLKEEHPDVLKDDVGVEALNMKKDAERAVELLEVDKQKAYRIAMGAETSTKVTSTSVNIAMAEQALASGNFELFNQLTKARSFEQTRRGQEINAEKGSVTDNTTARYVKELISAKMDELGKSYLADLKNVIPGKKITRVKQAQEVIKQEVEKAEKKVKSKEMDIKEAQNFLDSLACK